MSERDAASEEGNGNEWNGDEDRHMPTPGGLRAMV
jgi:hypothetical protein